MPKPGLENLGGNDRLKATNEQKDNDVGLKDFQADVVGGLAHADKALEEINKLNGDLEDLDPDNEKGESNDSKKDPQSEGQTSKKPRREGDRVQLSDIQEPVNTKELIGLGDIISEVIKGIDLPTPEARDLANEVLRMASTDQGGDFSPAAKEIYDRVQRLANDFQASEPKMRQNVIDHLS